MKINLFIRVGFVAMVSLSILQTAAAAGIKYSDGDKYVKFGGRVQLQYRIDDPDGGDSSDDLFLRRLRPYIEGSVHEDWIGKIQWEMGKATGENELAVKEAYMQYIGLDNMTVTLGNKNFPFSRETLTSSKKQQLVERTVVGDHNYGAPDKQLGVFLDGHNESNTRLWSFALVNAAIDPDNNKLDFDTLANRDDDFVAGWMIGGRIDFGGVKNEQANLGGDNKFGFAIGAFSWSNDEDNNELSSNVGRKTPVDSVTGIELSAAYRHGPWSIDAAYNTFDSELSWVPQAAADAFDVAEGVALGTTRVASGIYTANGDTTLEAIALEGGVLVNANKGEIVFAYEILDADGYAETWNQISFGYNWYIRKHDIKVQLTYEMNENQNGVLGNDSNIIFLQTQYVF